MDDRNSLDWMDIGFYSCLILGVLYLIVIVIKKLRKKILFAGNDHNVEFPSQGVCSNYKPNLKSEGNSQPHRIEDKMAIAFKEEREAFLSKKHSFEPLRRMVKTIELEIVSKSCPENFIDHFTGEILRNPVTLSNGKTYEQEELQKFIDTNGYIDPMSNEPISNDYLSINYMAKDTIESWLMGIKLKTFVENPDLAVLVKTWIEGSGREKLEVDSD